MTVHLRLHHIVVVLLVPWHIACAKGTAWCTYSCVSVPTNMP